MFITVRNYLDAKVKRGDIDHNFRENILLYMLVNMHKYINIGHYCYICIRIYMHIYTYIPKEEKETGHW